MIEYISPIAAMREIDLIKGKSISYPPFRFEQALAATDKNFLLADPP
jgi:hypothetical protein